MYLIHRDESYQGDEFYTTDYGDLRTNGLHDSGTRNPSIEYEDPLDNYAYSPGLYSQPSQAPLGHLDPLVDSNRVVAEVVATAVEHMRGSPDTTAFTLISDEAINGERMGRIHRSEGEAVRAVLFEFLQQHYLSDLRQNSCNTLVCPALRALTEAACQLMARSEGPLAMDICRTSLFLVLAEGPGKPTPRRSTPRQTFQCEHAACKNKTFSRSADLVRHRSIVHKLEDTRERFFCDYRRCSRHEQPFFRADHFRDHLRDQHKEDIVRRGSSADKDWWNSRNRHAMWDGWWRCSKCMKRVDTATYGFVCPGCGNNCEVERQKRRTQTK